MRRLHAVTAVPVVHQRQPDEGRRDCCRLSSIQWYQI